MNKLLKIVVIVLLLALLVVVRMFEDVLFYDPLLDFFKHDHSTKALPEFETVRLLVHLVFRFILNTLISLIILWVVFKDGGILKISGVIYGLAFVLLFALFCVLLFTSEEGPHMFLFYVRRFLIQPLFLLLLLPAFYLQKQGFGKIAKK